MRKRESWVAATIFLVCMAQAGHAASGLFECIMDPAKLVRLSALNSGVIEKIEVNRGDRVEAGQAVAQMNASMERATVDILKNRLASSAQIEAQDARVRFTEIQLTRMRQLVEQNAQSAVRLEEVEYEYDIARAQLAQAKNDQATLAAELDRAQAAYENTTIKSPVSGQVLNIALNAGENAGQDRHIMVIAKLDPLYVEAFLPIQLYNQVYEGMEVIIYPEDPVGGDHSAVISVIDPVVDTASRTFGIRINLENPGSRIPGGYRCKLDLVGLAQ
jgi:RND family efflux transporter MFP subunit